MWLLFYWNHVASVDDSEAMSYILRCNVVVVFIDSVCYLLLLLNAFRARYHAEIAPRIDREQHWFWAFVDAHPLIHFLILTLQSTITGPIVVWCAASAVWISSKRIRHGPPFEYVLALKPTEQKAKEETAVRLLDR
jgi:cobalamin synthase